MSVAERNIEIKRKHLCIKCFKKYQGKNCKASNCKLCKGFHNKLLHISKPLAEKAINNNEKKNYYLPVFPNPLRYKQKRHKYKQVQTISLLNTVGLFSIFCKMDEFPAGNVH